VAKWGRPSTELNKHTSWVLHESSPTHWLYNAFLWTWKHDDYPTELSCLPTSLVPSTSSIVAYSTSPWSLLVILWII
jgi:hypothetical protein